MRTARLFLRSPTKETKGTMTTHTKSKEKLSIVSVIAAMLAGFGVTMLLISGAYIRDLETLQSTPQAVWLFICGVPTEEPIIFPLLVTTGGGALLVGGLLVGFSLWRGRHKKPLTPSATEPAPQGETEQANQQET